MTEIVSVDQVGSLPSGSSKVYTVGETKVAVFNVQGTFYGIANRCPHRGASLGKGTLDSTVVTCPLHSWRFDLTTGRCLERPGTWVQRFPVTVDGETLNVEVDEQTDDSEWDGIYRYLVRYGTMGWVGRFGSVEPVACRRGQKVVVQTARGTELGEVLAGPDDLDSQPTSPNQQPTGEVLRRLGKDDDATPPEEPAELFSDCRQIVTDRGLPVEVVDCERLFDRQIAVLYYLGDETSQLGPLAVELGERHGVKVLFEPVLEPPPDDAGGGCGQGGCGSCG